MVDSHRENHDHAATGLGRRQFMLRAAVAGTVAFAVPTIVTMEPAGAAELTSPPPKPKPPVDVEVKAETVTAAAAVPTAPAVAADPATAAKPQVKGALAKTGADIDTLSRAGAAAVAGGAALHIWSTRAAARRVVTVDGAAEVPLDLPGTADS